MIAATVLLYHAQAVSGHVERGAIGVFQLHKFVAVFTGVEKRHASIAPNPIVHMHHAVARLQATKVDEHVRCRRWPRGTFDFLGLVAKDVVFPQDCEFAVRQDKPLTQFAHPQ